MAQVLLHLPRSLTIRTMKTELLLAKTDAKDKDRNCLFFKNLWQYVGEQEIVALIKEEASVPDSGTIFNKT